MMNPPPRRNLSHSNRRDRSGNNTRKGFLSITVILLLVGLLNGFDAVAAVRSPSSGLADRKHPGRKQQTSNNTIQKILRDDGNEATTHPALTHRGGARKIPPPPPPSMYWAVLHNWLYFLSLGFNAVNMPFLIRKIVDGDPTATPSPESIALSGNVEAVDKILTFGGVAVLAALSDRHGRKPLIAWSSLGFAATNFLQAFFAGRASTKGSAKALLYLADFVDGCSSCMTPVCQAYVADASPSSELASNLGVFQGISIGGAFILAFPIGGLLGVKMGPQLPIAIGGCLQLINGLLALWVTPESNERVRLKKAGLPVAGEEPRIRYSEVNPITGLAKLFGIGAQGGFGTTSTGLLRVASLLYFLLSLARGSLDAQFVNYSNIRFGWTQAQSGPVMVLTGLMLAIVPRIVVPILGLQKSINLGLLVVGCGLSSAGLVSTSLPFVGSILFLAAGMVAVPALQALLAGLASPGEAGALLGALGSMGELSMAISSTMYATLLATFATAEGSRNPLLAGAKNLLPDIPGMHFLVGAAFCFVAYGIASASLDKHGDHPALSAPVDKSALSSADL